MKKVLFAVLALLGVSVSAAYAAPVELRFTSVYIDRHPVVQNAFIPWMEEIKKRTNGEVVITYFNPGTICPNGEMFSAVRSGAVDIASTNTNLSNGALLLSDAANVPFLFRDAETAAMSVWRISQKYPEWAKEFDGMKLLTQYTSALMMIHSTKKPVTKFSDIRGKKLTTVGGLDRDVLKAFKANPIFVPLPDTYMSLSRGMADGCCLAIAPLRSFKITETIKYSVADSIAASPMWMAMSNDAWNRLTPEQQAVFTETTGEVLARAIGRALDDSSNTDAKWMEENGHVFNHFSAEEKAKLVKATAGIGDKWVKKAEKQGYANAAKILEDLRVLGQQTAAEVDQEKAGK